MKYKRMKSTVVARLFKGEEFITSVRKICEEEGISSGRIMAIGAVQKAILGYFDTVKKEYMNFECKGELVSCIGNIAQKEGEIVVHAHAVIGDKNGNCKGGHIVTAEASATVEIFIEDIPGLKRTLDAETDLYLLDL